MRELIKRTLVGLFFILVITLLIVFSLHPLFRYVVALVVALFTAVAMWEYRNLAIVKGGRIGRFFLMCVAAAQVLSFFFSAIFPFFSMLPLLIFLVSLMTLFALHFQRNEGALIDLALSAFGLLYVAVPMGMILSILYSPTLGDARWWIAYLLVVTKISDIGAYFGGHLLGRFKLAPRISPGKTIEGAIVGLCCSLGASYCFSLFAPMEMGSFGWLGLGLLLGVVAPFGDLTESLLKRDAHTKDSNTLPGLGGFLDAIDSLLFNSAILYIYLYLS